MALLVKNLPAMRETWIRSLGWEDPLEKSYPLSKPFWLREFHGLYKSMGLQRLPTPLFWPREFHGLHSPWGHKESDMVGYIFIFHSTVKCIAFKPL